MSILPVYKNPPSLDEAKAAICQLGRSMAEHAYLVGKYLQWVKQEVEHGEFIPWVESNLWFNMRTAQRMMAFAEQCDSASRLLEYEQRHKSDIKSYLPSREDIVTVYETNAAAIAAAAKLFIPDGAVVADVTYGRGTFWAEIDTTRFKLLRSDLITCKERYDFRNLPYSDGSIDTVVLDPPYVHTTGTHMTEVRYNHGTTNGLNHAGIVELYNQGTREAVRVLKPGGRLFLKCKDEIESGVQRRTQIEIYLNARSLRLIDNEMFIVVAISQTSPKRWTRQLHARKIHSYLWIFESPS